MDEKELRIGNLVTYHGTLMAIRGITAPCPRENGKYNNEFIIELFDGAGVLDCALKEIESITLTEEWAGKLGMVYNDLNGDSGHYQVSTENGVFEILYSSEENRFIFNNQYIDYVHILQNVFYFSTLTKEELKLFI